MADAKWKRFEKIVHQIHSQLAPQGAVVRHNDKIVGHESGVERQLDITILIAVAGYPILIVVECKDEARPIDVNVIGEFASTLSDVKANKGVIVSSAGFTQAAVNMARARGIETRTYVDTESMDWRSEVSIPMLLKSTVLEGWNVTFTSIPGYPCAGLPATEFPHLEVFDRNNQSIGWIVTLLGSHWMHDESLQTVGTHSTVLAEHGVIDFKGALSHVKITANLKVVHRSYLGPLPIQVQGLRDDQSGSLWTNTLRTAPIDASAISRGKVPGWMEVLNIDELAVRPVMTLDVMDALPETPEEFERFRAEAHTYRELMPD